MNVKSTEEQLNSLLTRNYDAEQGYLTVADKIEHPEMKNFMQQNSQDRNSFGHEIKEIMSELNLKPDKGTSLSGDVHRAWINLKELLSQNSDEAILAEAARGEEYAIAAYEETINTPGLSPSHKRILSDHLNSIKKTREQITKLKATL